MIKKGEELVCENGHAIGIALIDMEHGDKINAHDFEWKQKKYKNGDNTEYCQSLIIQQTNPPDQPHPQSPSH